MQQNDLYMKILRHLTQGHDVGQEGWSELNSRPLSSIMTRKNPKKGSYT